MASGYLSSEQLTGFEHYKYSALDTNPLSIYVMHPFWNAAVKLCPQWLAPNLLTFSGFLFTVANFLLFSYYDYSFYASSESYSEYPVIPTWVWLVAALNHFLAYTLDGIDGKQARRTKSSSPLGELFDHGLDSWASLLIPTCLYSVFGRADYSISPLRFYLCLWSIFITFISSHWEKYNTKVLYLPWGYDASQVGPRIWTLKLICIFILMWAGFALLSILDTVSAVTFILYIMAFFKGVEYFYFEFPVIHMSPGLCLELFLHVGAYGLSLPVSLINIYLSYKKETGKMLSAYEANRPLVSTMVFCIVCMMWVLYSPYDIINKDPRCVYVLTGTVFSNICCRLIVAQMTNTRSELLNWMIFPVALAATLSITLFNLGAGELFLLYAVTIFCVAVHIHYGFTVVNQMCQHFNLHCFVLKKPPSTD